MSPTCLSRQPPSAALRRRTCSGTASGRPASRSHLPHWQGEAGEALAGFPPRGSQRTLPPPPPSCMGLDASFPRAATAARTRPPAPACLFVRSYNKARPFGSVNVASKRLRPVQLALMMLVQVRGAKRGRGERGDRGGGTPWEQGCQEGQAREQEVKGGREGAPRGQGGAEYVRMLEGHLVWGDVRGGSL